MNPLLLLGSLTAARRSVGDALARLSRGFFAYALLVCSGLVALGFSTAGGFLYISSMWGAVTASMIIATIYAILGSICFLAIRVPRVTVPLPQARPLSSSVPQIETITALNRDLPSSVIAVGLLAAAGYFVGRVMTRRR